MNNGRRTLLLLLVLSFMLAVFSGLAYAKLPEILQLSCERDAYLYKSPTDYQEPPNDECWGWYRGHAYFVAGKLGRAAMVTEISAKVTGGISELNQYVDGFKLQVIWGRDMQLGQLMDDRELLFVSHPWRTLMTFAAPCAAGSRELVYWEGKPMDIIAVRIEAPNGKYVDYSEVWLEY